MIKFENYEVVGWEHAVRGMRNPKNSWDRSDSYLSSIAIHDGWSELGEKDHELMMKLAKGGPVHAKYRRMITVYVDITAPLYWWKEFDTYKVGTVANSCSTMHKIHEKEFTLDDFSCEKLAQPALSALNYVVDMLNVYRDLYVHWDEKHDNTKNALLVGVLTGGEYNKKWAWEQIIQLLPTSYNQKRTVMMNYEVLNNIYISRKNHKLDEWRALCDWIEGLPYSEIITGLNESERLSGTDGEKE